MPGPGRFNLSDMKKILSLLVVLSAFVAQSVLACGDQACDQCAKQSPKSAQVTKNGRKIKCSKCAEHEAKAEKPANEKAPHGSDDGSQPAKT